MKHDCFENGKHNGAGRYFCSICDVQLDLTAVQTRKTILKLKTEREIMKKELAIQLVVDELEKANDKFPLFNSSHEGYAVLKEEVDELWDEIKNNKNPMTMVSQKKEAIQVGAMAIKFLMSCCKEHL